jgi:hypothetical protein
MDNVQKVNYCSNFILCTSYKNNSHVYRISKATDRVTRDPLHGGQSAGSSNHTGFSFYYSITFLFLLYENHKQRRTFQRSVPHYMDLKYS